MPITKKNNKIRSKESIFQLATAGQDCWQTKINQETSQLVDWTKMVDCMILLIAGLINQHYDQFTSQLSACFGEFLVTCKSAQCSVSKLMSNLLLIVFTFSVFLLLFIVDNVKILASNPWAASQCILHILLYII